MLDSPACARCRAKPVRTTFRRRVWPGVLMALVPGLLALVPGCHTGTPAELTPTQVHVARPETGRPARPSPLLPDVLARTTWTGEAPIISRLTPMGQPWRITVHHEGMDTNDLTSAQAVAARLRTITEVQQRPTSHGGLGAGDLAYHYCIDRAGRIWEGRSLAWQGAHAGNLTANAGNIGIVVLGNFELQRPTPEQLSSLRRLLSELCDRHGISGDRIYGHNEIKAQYGLAPTRCPGRFLSAWLRSFRGESTAAR